MIQFQVDEKRSELLDAVRKLDRATGGKINTHQVIIVETEDQDLADILNVMLGPGRIGGKQDFVLMNVLEAEKPVELPVIKHPGIEITKRQAPARTGTNGNGHQAKTRKCIICGDEFELKRGGGKVCGKLECKRAIQKKYNQKYLSKKKIQSVVPAMEVPADAPGPLAGIQMGNENHRPISGIQMGGE